MVRINATVSFRLSLTDPEAIEFVFSAGGDRRSGTTSSPELVSFLLALDAPTPRAEVVARAAADLDLETGAAEELVASLQAKGLLVDGDAPKTAQATEAEARWIRWGWRDALDFHVATRDSAFTPGDASGMAKQIEELSAFVTDAEAGRDEPAPSPYKDYPEAARVELPRSRARVDAASFGHALRHRRTCRSFSKEPVALDVFAELLEHAFGKTGEIDYFLGSFLLKTSPSGGGLHPTEVYPIVFGVDGVAPGIYHYSVRHHALELLRAGDFSAEVYDIAHQQSGMSGVAAAFFFTVRWDRHIWKYRYARSYRSALFDVAHVVQTTLLTASALRLKSFLTPAIKDTAAVELLGLGDDLVESPLYATSIGGGR